ncbi:MAG: hypothetical protein PWP65_1099 [Clostridia bacterium]|nr:hypothetical protein [Clostridia bacterium]
MDELTALTEVLERTEDAGERVDVVCKIAALRAPGSAKVLVQAFARETDLMVRETIVASLLICDTEEVVEEVAPLLKSEDASLRSMAFEVLAYKGDEKCMSIFEALLQEADRDVRVMAVHALGRGTCPGALSLLRKAAAVDQDINVVGAAIEYISEIGEPGDAELVEKCRERFSHPYLDFIVQRALARLRGEFDKIAS